MGRLRMVPMEGGWPRGTVRGGEHSGRSQGQGVAEDPTGRCFALGGDLSPGFCFTGHNPDSNLPSTTNRPIRSLCCRAAKWNGLRVSPGILEVK